MAATAEGEALRNGRPVGEEEPGIGSWNRSPSENNNNDDGDAANPLVFHGSAPKKTGANAAWRLSTTGMREDVNLADA